MKKFSTLSLVVLIFAAIGLTSCESEPVDPVLSNPENNNPGGGGNSGDGTYFPTAVGNTWTYNVSNGNESAMTIVGTETVGGETFYKLGQTTSLSGNSVANSLIRVSNGDYRVKSAATSQGASVSGIDYIMLKDYLNVNETWTDNYIQVVNYNVPGIPNVELPVTIDCTILEKGISMQVEGETYTDVILCRTQQTVTGDGFLVITTTDSWYAKNVGLIKAIATSADGSITQTLTSYNIN